MFKDRWNKFKQKLRPEAKQPEVDITAFKDEPKVRKRIVFHGEVQGVGFRWRAREAAQALGLSGWVRNNSDGTVTLEVQGCEQAIAHMIGMIDAGS